MTFCSLAEYIGSALVHTPIRTHSGFAGAGDRLDVTASGTHTLRRTKASLIYRRTKNLSGRAVTAGAYEIAEHVRYLGIEMDDALRMAEQTKCKAWRGSATIFPVAYRSKT